MRARTRLAGAALGIAALASGAALALARERAPVDVLRVCADPNNLPFSNRNGEGFENRLAELIAADLGVSVEYTWWAQRRGFVRNTLNTGTCDVIMGVPGSFELSAVTRPYYRSTYVFVTRRGRNLDIASFDDPQLRTLRVGVHLIGDDFANTPPAHALAARGIVGNVKGYSIYGDYTEPNPPTGILRALVADEIDVAVVWGPLAGSFALTSAVPLDLRPVSPQVDLPFLPMVYDIALGVRRADEPLRLALDEILVRRRADIDALLREYGVPRVDVVRHAGGS